MQTWMIFIVLAGILLGHAVLSLVERLVARRSKERAKRAEEAQKRAAVVDELADQVKALSQISPAMLPALIQGLEAMCKELCRTNDLFVKTVETFQRSIDGSSLTVGSREEDEETETEQEVRTLIRKGVPQAEAEARVRERRLYAGMERR